MSATVDQRIARMQLDNSQFEKAAKQTISTLNELDKSLDLKNASKSLKDVEDTANRLSLANLEKSVAAIQDRFSVLGTFTHRIFEKITDDVYATGKKIANALSVEPLKAGFREYETQINAVQTILANTSSKGTGLDDVNAALDELNTYADKTIYNFTEMTRNIGTFTAAGIDLDTSVQAIKGIANLAAVSGSTSQQASTAMYQLSQALAAGTVKLMDWNSVVNAGMGGQVFQDALKETARLHGVAIDEMIAKEGSFRETLKEGWITSSVLTETLAKFTGDMTEEQLKAMGYTEEQIASIIKMGETANDAATKVKTFTQLFDTLNEALQSGWTQSWEIIIGDFEEAKELLTEISDLFSGMIGESAQARNDLLESALGDASTVVDEFGALVKVSLSDSSIQDALVGAAGPYSEAVKQMITDSGSFEESLKQCWLTADILNNGIAMLAGGVDVNSESFEKLSDVADRVLNGEFGEGEAQIKALTDAGYDYAEVQKVVTTKLAMTEDGISKLSDEQIENTGYTREQLQALKDLANESETSGKSIVTLYQEMQRPSGRELIIDSFRNALDGLLKIMEVVKTAWHNVFPPATADQIYAIVERIHDFSKGLTMSKETAEKLESVLTGFFSAIKLGVDVVGVIAQKVWDLAKNLTPLGKAVLDVASNFGDYITNMVQSGKVLETFKMGLDTVIGFLKNAVEQVKQFLGSIGINFRIPAFSDLKDQVQGFIDNLKNAKGDFGGVLKGFDSETSLFSGKMYWTILEIQGKFDKFVEKVKEVVEKIKGVLSPVWDKIKEQWSKVTFTDVVGTGLIGGVFVQIKNFAETFKKFTSIFGGVADSFKKTLDTTREALETWQKSIKADMILKIAIAIGILAASVALLAKVSDSALQIGVATAAITALVFSLVSALKKLDGVELEHLDAGKIAAIMALSLATLALSKALGELSELDFVQIITGAAALTAMTAALSLATGFLSNEVGDGSKFLLVSAGIYTFASAIKKLAQAMMIVAGLDWQTAKQGLLIIGGMLGEISLVMLAAKGAKSGSANALAIAAAVLVLYEAVKLFGVMDPEIVTKGIECVGAISIFLGIASALAGLSGSGAAKIIALAAAVNMMMIPIKQIARMYEENAEGLQKSVEMVAILTVIIGGITAVMGLAGSFGGYSGMASGLIGLSVAVIALATALKMMQDMSIGTMIADLAVLAAAIGGFAVLSAVLAPISPVILTIAAAFAVFSASTILLGAGIASLTVGLTTLAVSAPAVGLGLTTLITSVISGLVLGIATGISSFILGLAEIAATILLVGPTIMAAVEQVLMDIVGIIDRVGGAILTTVVDLILQLVQAIADRMPEFVAAGSAILYGLNEGAKIMLPLLGEMALTALQTILDVLTGAADQLIQAGVKLIKSLLEGANSLIDDVIQFGVKLVNSLLDGAAGLIDDVVQFGVKLIRALLQGAAGLIDDVVDFAVELIVTFVEALAREVPVLVEAGLTIIQGLLEGLNNHVGDIVTVVVDLVLNFIKALEENTVRIIDAGFKMIIDFMHGIADAIRENMPEVIEAAFDIADAIIDGVIEGLTNGVTKLWDTAQEVASNVFDSFKEFFGINSPSRLMKEEVGKNIVDGITQGIGQNKSAENAADSKSKSILDIFKKYTGNTKKEVGEPMAENMAEGITNNTAPEKAAKSKVQSTTKAAEEEIKLVKDDLGNLFVQGIANGITADMSAEEAAVQKAKNIAEAFKKELDALDLQKSISDLQYDVWDSYYGDSASDYDRAKAKADSLQQAYDNRKKAKDLAEDEYRMNLEQFGLDSQQELEARKKLLEAQLEVNKTQNELKEAQKELETAKKPVKGPITSTSGGSSSSSRKEEDPSLSAPKGSYLNPYDEETVRKYQEALAKQAAEQANKGGQQIGQAMAEGTTQGLKKKIQGPITATSGMATSMTDQAKKDLGVHSPSRVFYEIGQWVDRGLGNGITSLSDMVVDAMSNGVLLPIADAASSDRSIDKAMEARINSLSLAMQMADDILTSSESAPVIRPIVDMTNANAAATQLNSLFGAGGYTSGLLSYNSASSDRKRAMLLQTASTSIADDSRIDAILSRIDRVGERIYDLHTAIDGMSVTIDGTALIGRIREPLTVSQGLSRSRSNRGI